MKTKLIGKAVVSGSAKGSAVVSRQNLSFWGGIDPYTGEVIDRRHDKSGVTVKDKVFLFPQGKGSSTASAVLIESIKQGTAPVAIINTKMDPILALGAVIAELLYRRTTPIMILTQQDFDSIQEDDYVVIHPDGTILVNP